MADEEEKQPSPASAAEDDRDQRASSSSLTVENVRLHTEQTKKKRSDSGASINSSKDSQPLAPLKTTASTTARSSVVSDITGSNTLDEKELQLPKNKPLPPIAVKDDDDFIEDAQKIKGSNSESSASSPPVESSTPVKSLFFNKGEGRPGFDDVASVKSAESRSSRRTVSFAESETSKSKSAKKESIATKEVSKRKGPDGKEFVVISIDAQTEWSWLEDLKSVGKSALSDPVPVPVSKPAEEDNIEESGTPTTKSKSIPSTPSGTSVPQEDVEVYPKASVSDAYGVPLLELSSDSDFSDDEDSQSEPPGEMVDETDMVQGIGPPQILQYKRESLDQAPDVDDPRKLAPSPDPNADMADGVTSFEDFLSAPCEYCENPVKPFPTLEQQDSQPPEDLFCCDKYRELVHFTLTHPMNEESKRDKKIDIAPHPPHGSKLARKAAKERAAQRMREREMQRQQAAVAAMTTGAAPTNFFSSGTPNRISDIARQMKTINYQLSSQRCLEEGWTVRIPSPLRDDDGEQDIFLAEPLSEFDDEDDYQFIDLMDQSQYEGDSTARDDTQRTERGKKKTGKGAKSHEVDGKGSKHGVDQPTPSADDLSGDGPKGRKGKRAQKDKEGVPGGKDKEKGASKTRVGKDEEDKNYSLLTPEDAAAWEDEMERQRERDVARKQALKALAKAKRRMLRQWYYPDGSKFLTIFPDGSGNVFYPSGNLAVLISLVSRGQLAYIIYDDESETGTQTLGVFEPNGFVGCYFGNGQLRLYLDQFGGIEHDFQGGRKRRWSWKDQSSHVHAPPFQPICFSLNSRLSVRVMSQANIALTFRDKNRSCRFNVGAKLKLVNPRLIPPKEIDEDALYINEVKAKVETLLNRVSNLLKFPKSPKLEKMKPPLHVTSLMERNERLRNKIANKQSTEKGKGAPVVVVN